LVGADLYAFDHGPNDFATGRPVCLFQTMLNLFGKIIDLADDQPKLLFFRFSTIDFRGGVFKPLEPFPRLINAWKEFCTERSAIRIWRHLMSWSCGIVSKYPFRSAS
jgi:hypothetical protein